MQRRLQRWIAACFAAAFVLGLCSCHPSTRQPGEVSMAMTVTSTAFSQGSPIPVAFTGQGADVSPDLAWSGSPAATRSYVLICEDPDAPGGTWVHWTMWNIPASTSGLPSGVARNAHLNDGSVQGITSFGGHGYGGAAATEGSGSSLLLSRLCPRYTAGP